jgi:BirA family transcriptional regulator, biotin operon repressor / biotin---[acetyl-CoA-carboxylase] ligase
VLRELSAAQFTSGADIARRHGVSRSAVSDAMKDAANLGVQVFSLTKRGYRLAEPLELLDLATLRAQLGATQSRVDVQLADVIDSTNSALLNQALLGAPSGTCLAAEVQTAGRGRRGRAWQSALGASLTFSMLWRFNKGAAELGGLSLAVGVAVARALRALGVDARLKWPNDIVMNDRKLGGILIETQGDMLGPTIAVVGIGLNLRLPDQMKASIDQPVTDIATETRDAAVTAPAMSRNTLLARTLTELVGVLDPFQQHGFGGLVDAWRALNAHAGRMVEVNAPDGVYLAKVVDVSPSGALIVERGSVRTQLTAAELSVRLADTASARR